MQLIINAFHFRTQKLVSGISCKLYVRVMCLSFSILLLIQRSFSSCSHPKFSYVSSMKEAVECNSSLVPHSFSSSVVSLGNVHLLSCSVSGQLISTRSGICNLCAQSHRGVLPIFSLCMCALRRQWPVLNRNIVV